MTRTISDIEVKRGCSIVSVGDDVECAAADLVQLIAAHINMSEECATKFKGMFKGLTQSSILDMETVGVLSVMADKVIECAVRTILENETL